MRRVTGGGGEINGRSETLVLTMWASARRAMDACSTGGITRSAVPTSAQDGIVRHAGAPDGAVTALSVAGRWVAARIAPLRRGRSFAKHLANPGNEALFCVLT